MKKRTFLLKPTDTLTARFTLGKNYKNDKRAYLTELHNDRVYRKKRFGSINIMR